MQPSARNLRFRCACRARLGRDFLASFGRDFGSPRQRPTSVGQALVLPIDSATRTCACRRASFGDGLPALRSTGSPEERQGPPRLLGHPLRTCRGSTLRRNSAPPRPLRNQKRYGEADIVFAKNRTLDIRNDYSFRSHLPTAHTFACLRFADRVTETVARLTTGSGGLTPGRARFAPAGRQTKFHEVIASSNPNRPAEPGRTVLPILSRERRPVAVTGGGAPTRIRRAVAGHPTSFYPRRI